MCCCQKDVGQIKIEDISGACGMLRPPEAGLAVGVDCIPFGGDAVSCSSVGCEKVFGGLPRPPEMALDARLDDEHALGLGGGQAQVESAQPCMADTTSAVAAVSEDVALKGAREEAPGGSKRAHACGLGEPG